MRSTSGSLLAIFAVLYALLVLLSEHRAIPSGSRLIDYSERIAAEAGLIQTIVLRRQLQSKDYPANPNTHRIMKVQQALKDDGFYSGSVVDGSMRQSTRERIRSFQESNQLIVTGTIDDDTVRELPDADLTGQREVVDAFLAALRGDDFDRLVAVLDPDVVIRADRTAAPAEGSREVRGARACAKQALAYSRFAHFARPALVNGAVGVVVAPRGRLFRVLHFTLTRGKIVQIDVVADPARLRQLDLAVLNDLTSQPTLRLGSASGVPGRSGTARSASARTTSPPRSDHWNFAK